MVRLGLKLNGYIVKYINKNQLKPSTLTKDIRLKCYMGEQPVYISLLYKKKELKQLYELSFKRTEFSNFYRHNGFYKINISLVQKTFKKMYNRSKDKKLNLD